MFQFQKGYNYHLCYVNIINIDKYRLEFKYFQNLLEYFKSLFINNERNITKQSIDCFYSNIGWIYNTYFKDQSDAEKVGNFLQNSKNKSIADLMDNYLVDINENDKLKEYFIRINGLIESQRIIEIKNNKDECNLVFHRRSIIPKFDTYSETSFGDLLDYFDYMDIEYTDSIGYQLNFDEFMVEYNKLMEDNI